MKANHDLARQAAGVLWKQDRQTFESVTKIIEDAYAEAMAERDKLRRQVEFVKRKHPKQLKSGPLMLDRCQCCDGWNGKCEPDCPNNEGAQWRS